MLLPTTEANQRGPATRKSQDSPWNFPHCTVTGEPRGSGGAERGPCQQHSSPPEGTTLSKTEAFSSCRPSLLPILWETALDRKTASYLPWLPSSSVFPRIQVSHSLSGSRSSTAGSPVASLMQAPSLLPRHRAAAATLQQGQRDVALPQSHTPRPGRQVEEALGSMRLSAKPTQHSQGRKLLRPSSSGLETSLPQSNPAHAKFPSAALQSPKICDKEGVSQELKGKARSWNWRANSHPETHHFGR